MTITQMKTRPTPRAEDTRRRIYESALKLFRQKGFEPTTVRDIAAEAGVALGAAYYYFSSKEAIVLAFYQELQAPNRKFCDALFRHAPDTHDPLSPFSAETRPIRERAVEHLRAALEGSD